jgi:hypothetical protein
VTLLPGHIGPGHIGAMSSGQVILGELLSSRARLRFPSHAHPQPSTPVRQENPSERQTGLLPRVSKKGVTLKANRPLSTPESTQITQNK